MTTQLSFLHSVTLLLDAGLCSLRHSPHHPSKVLLLLRARRHNGLAVPCIGRPRPAVSTSIRTVPLGSSVVFLIHHQPLQDDCKENDAVTGWSLSITCTQWRSFNFRFSHPGFADRCWRALAAGTIDVDLDLDEEWMT